MLVNKTALSSKLLSEDHQVSACRADGLLSRERSILFQGSPERSHFIHFRFEVWVP